MRSGWRTAEAEGNYVACPSLTGDRQQDLGAWNMFGLPGADVFRRFIECSRVVVLTDFEKRVFRQERPQRRVRAVCREIFLFILWCEGIRAEEKAVGILVDEIRGDFQ